MSDDEAEVFELLRNKFANKDDEIQGLRNRIELLKTEIQELRSTNNYLRNKKYGASDYEVN